MGYVLEDVNEFERLERQSTFPKYDYRQELLNFSAEPGATILDAGCGSGIVARYLADKFRAAKVIGCDQSELRVAKAKKKATQGNLEFMAGDLTALPFADNMFDAVVIRYVMQHLPVVIREKATAEIFRCLKPGGVLWAIDFDGAYLNFYPRTPIVDKVLNLIERGQTVDLLIGRKIPSLLAQAGFERLRWRIETIAAQGEFRVQELELMHERLTNLIPFVTELTGSRKDAEDFRDAYIKSLKAPETVLFHNKFIVNAIKPGRGGLQRVK